MFLDHAAAQIIQPDRQTLAEMQVVVLVFPGSPRCQDYLAAFDNIVFQTLLKSFIHDDHVRQNDHFIGREIDRRVNDVAVHLSLKEPGVELLAFLLIGEDIGLPLQGHGRLGIVIIYHADIAFRIDGFLFPCFFDKSHRLVILAPLLVVGIQDAETELLRTLDKAAVTEEDHHLHTVVNGIQRPLFRFIRFRRITDIVMSLLAHDRFGDPEFFSLEASGKVQTEGKIGG